MVDSQRLLNDVRDFVEQAVRPRAREFDEQQAIPRSFIEEMGKQGFLSIPFPEEYGGWGFDPVLYGRATEEIAKGCSSVRSLLTVHTSLVGETLVRWGTARQKARLLPAMARGQLLTAFALSEPEVGSDARAVATTYSRRGSAYILNGRKKWVSFGAMADLLLVVAANSGRITTFLVEAGKTRRTLIPGMLGLRGSQVAEVELMDVEVSPEDVMGSEGEGFEYVVQTALDSARANVAWGALGLAQEALEAMVTHARTRRQFNEFIHQFQLIRGMIGDAVTNVHAARAVCERMGLSRAANDLDAAMETNMAKYFATKVAAKVAADAVQVLGASGCVATSPVERLYRDAKVLEIIEGSSQIQQLLISEYGLKRYLRKAARRA
jgi:alkylation response protein AidB-like acyl-CoA dehydrogenase